MVTMRSPRHPPHRLGHGRRNAGESVGRLRYRVLILERGDYLPREPGNWSPEAVFGKNRFKTEQVWESAAGGESGAHDRCAGDPCR